MRPIARASRAGKCENGDAGDLGLDITEWTPASPGQQLADSDREYSRHERLNQDSVLAADRDHEDEEHNGDREAVNEYGDDLDKGEFDPAELDASTYYPGTVGLRGPVECYDPQGNRGVLLPIPEAPQ